MSIVISFYEFPFPARLSSLCNPEGAPRPASVGFGAWKLSFPLTTPFPPSPTKSGEDARGGCLATLPRTRDGEQRDGAEGSHFAIWWK